MRLQVFKPGPVMWALCACLLLLPPAAVAGERSLASDKTPMLLAHPSLQLIAAVDLVGQDRKPEEDLSAGDFGQPALVRTSLQALPDGASSACVLQLETTTCPASPASRPFSPRPPPV
jgi:hypothetical protein